MDKTRGIVQTRRNAQVAEQEQGRPKSVAQMLNETLSQSGFQRRFDELMGKRAPQFVSSLASLVSSTPALLDVFSHSPVQVIQCALKAAAYDLPIEPSLGYAYILPFNTKGGGAQATFVLGYKGMVQLALRTGLYLRLNAVDVREGELVSYDRLTEDIEFNWEPDNAKRSRLPVIGYVAFYRLKNGMEKTLYMTKAEIDEHEQSNRKGYKRNPVWNQHYDEMAKKTVLRRLLSKWGIMSINYLEASPADQEVMRNMAEGTLDDDDTPLTIDNDAPAGPQDAPQAPMGMNTPPDGREANVGAPDATEDVFPPEGGQA